MAASSEGRRSLSGGMIGPSAGGAWRGMVALGRGPAMKANRSLRQWPLFLRLRGLWPDRNPLRRRFDRVETVILAGLLAAFLMGAPIAGLVAGRWAYGSALQARRTELSASHHVSAVLLTSASRDPVGFVASARASWTAPNGARRTGDVVCTVGSPPGTRIWIWVTASGRMAIPPLLLSQAEGQGVLAAALAVAGLAMVLWSAGLLIHVVTDRHRLAAWDAEWCATGPKWSHRG